jgi:hypothetical protein
MRAYKIIHDYLISLLFAVLAVWFIVLGKQHETLKNDLKEAHESLAMIETKLDHESFERVQCQAILGYVTQESMRLTELIVKNKGKK